MMANTSPLGSVAQLGEVKVRPLSVPASMGETSILALSSHSPSWHRSRSSRPVNQSGEGTMAVMHDSWGWRGLSTAGWRISYLSIVTICKHQSLSPPLPCSIEGAKTASRKEMSADSLSRMLLSPFSTNILTPSDTAEPVLNREMLPLWV